MERHSLHCRLFYSQLLITWVSCCCQCLPISPALFHFTLDWHHATLPKCFVCHQSQFCWSTRQPRSARKFNVYLCFPPSTAFSQQTGRSWCMPTHLSREVNLEVCAPQSPKYPYRIMLQQPILATCLIIHPLLPSLAFLSQLHSDCFLRPPLK